MVDVVLGGIAVALTQFLKKHLGLEGVPALWLAFAVSVILALIGALATGQLSLGPVSDPVAFVSALGKDAGIVFTTATLIYRHVKEENGGGSQA